MTQSKLKIAQRLIAIKLSHENPEELASKFSLMKLHAMLENEEDRIMQEEELKRTAAPVEPESVPEPVREPDTLLEKAFKFFKN